MTRKKELILTRGPLPRSAPLLPSPVATCSSSAWDQLFSVCCPLGCELLSHLLFQIFMCSWFSGWMRSRVQLQLSISSLMGASSKTEATYKWPHHQRRVAPSLSRCQLQVAPLTISKSQHSPALLSSHWLFLLLPEP